MSRQGVYFDRDNTLIVCDGYLGDPNRVRLMVGAAGAVGRARRLGFGVVVVSNQSGVARGMYTEADVRACNARLDELLVAEDAGAVVERHEYCPFHPAAALLEYRKDSELRKPRPGMILKAMRELDLQGGWAIGDAPRDIVAGQAAGLRTILFRPQGVARSSAADEPLNVKAEFEVTSLEDAMNIIERETKAEQGKPAGAAVGDNTKIERLLEQLLTETKRANHPADFSVARLLAGVVQILVLAVLFLTYLDRGESVSDTVNRLLLAIVMQTLVTSLLVMGRK